MNGTRRLCPSCQTRRSPLAVECPVCGLGFNPAERPRALLFQASGLGSSRPRKAEAPPLALQAPALGRVAPIAVETPAESAQPLSFAASFSAPVMESFGKLDSRMGTEVSSFWPLVLLEGSEALLLGLLNLFVLLLTSWMLHASPLRLLNEAWMLLLPFHLTLSWALLMVPLVLSGQSPLMPHWNLMLFEGEPERRMVFALVHLVSVLAFPLSFLCMILTPRHQTLAEYLSGQEIINRPLARLR